MEKAQGTNTTGNLEAEMLGTKKRSATERHREQLRKLEKEKKEAQEVRLCFPFIINISKLANPCWRLKNADNGFLVLWSGAQALVNYISQS